MLAITWRRNKVARKHRSRGPLNQRRKGKYACFEGAQREGGVNALVKSCEHKEKERPLTLLSSPESQLAPIWRQLCHFFHFYFYTGSMVKACPKLGLDTHAHNSSGAHRSHYLALPRPPIVLVLSSFNSTHTFLPITSPSRPSFLPKIPNASTPFNCTS